MRNVLFVTGAVLFTAAAVSCGSGSEDIEGVETFDVDGVKVTWIRDNAQPRIMERTLFSDAPDSLIDALGLQDGVPASISVFLVEKDGRKMLFDTGLGMPGCRLLPSLEAIGLEPEDIDCIFLTHFHGDHIGGMVTDSVSVFPEADVYAARAKYDAWMAMPADAKAQVEKTMEIYGDRVHLFGAGDSLPYGVEAVAAPGHTPGHTAYQIGKLLIVGDLMHGVALQMPHPEVCANYDMDKPMAAATRVGILEYAKNDKLVMAGMHFPEPGIISAGIQEESQSL